MFSSHLPSPQVYSYKLLVSVFGFDNWVGIDAVYDIGGC